MLITPLHVKLSCHLFEKTYKWQLLASVKIQKCFHHIMLWFYWCTMIAYKLKSGSAHVIISYDLKVYSPLYNFNHLKYKVVILYKNTCNTYIVERFYEYSTIYKWIFCCNFVSSPLLWYCDFLHYEFGLWNLIVGKYYVI